MFAVFKSPRQGTSSLLTVMRIGHRLCNCFSSSLCSFTTSPIVLSSQLRATSVMIKTFFLCCSVHTFEAGLKAGWMDGGWVEEIKKQGSVGFKRWFLLPVAGFKAREGWNANKSLHGSSCWLYELLEAVLITSAVWICECVHSHLVCQHLNWLLLLKTCPKNNMKSGVRSVIPRSTLCTHASWIRPEGNTRDDVSFVPVLKANLKAGPLAQTFSACPDTAHQPILYAQGCRKPPLCSCFKSGRNEAVVWMLALTWALCETGPCFRKAAWSSRGWNQRLLSSMYSVQVEVVVKSNRFCKLVIWPPGPSVAQVQGRVAQQVPRNTVWICF